MLKNMKIGRKLALGFALVLSLMAVVSTAGYWGLETVAALARDILTVRSQLVEHSQRARADTLGLRRFEKDYFLNIGDREKEAEYLGKWKDQKQRLLGQLDTLEKLVQTDADRDVLRRGLAASEVVAASAGRAAKELPAAARGLAERHAERLRPLRAKARAALELIRSRRAEEIDARDLYDEPDAATEQAERDDRDWQTQMDLLSMRLSD